MMRWRGALSRQPAPCIQADVISPQSPFPKFPNLQSPKFRLLAMVIRIDDNTKQELISYSQDKIPLHDSFSFHFFACMSLVCINRARVEFPRSEQEFRSRKAASARARDFPSISSSSSPAPRVARK